MVQIKKALLAGIQLPQVSNQEHEASMQELNRLVATLGYAVVGKISQKRSSERSPAVFGEGRLKTLAEWTGGTGIIASGVERKLSKAAVKQLEESEHVEEESDDDDIDDPTEPEEEAPKERAEIVIFDSDLSPSQLRNLESAIGVPVLDRTGVIIEIFSRHARTRSAKLQVEIARLAYMAPRLRETGGGADREGGGGKGSGETSLELDKRHIRDRIKELKTELASIEDEHLVRRARRQQEISVALVGYTNAGKSSLMRALTGSDVLVADKLFATLDTTVRPLFPESRPKILVSDTVGFIKKLPHDLVASFKSTLDEALNASLLLYVVDSSDPTFRAQLNVSRTVLAEVGAQDIPSFLILNKRDRLSSDEAAKLKIEFPEAIFLSTRDKNDLKLLRERLIQNFETDMIDEDIFIPYTVGGAIGEIRDRMRVLAESYDEKGTTLRVRSTAENLARIKKKFVPN